MRLPANDTDLHTEPAGVSLEVQAQKGLRLEVGPLWVYRLASGKGRCRLEGTLWGDSVGQVGRERDALSIDYHTEHPCALAGLRLCRRTKP